MLTGYNIVNVDDLINEFGEAKTKTLLLEFLCPLNADVEFFLHKKAIEFSKQSLSKTHLIYTSYKGEVVLIGYFSLCPKPLLIKKGLFSKTFEKRIRKFSSQSQTGKEYSISTILIAQFGKNYKNGYDKLIKGDELLKIAIDMISTIHKMLGGKIIYLECEENQKLIDFYNRNGFVNFGRRKRDHDEIEHIKSEYLVQMLKYL